MQDKLITKYPGSAWKQRVLLMSEQQLLAIYMKYFGPEVKEIHITETPAKHKYWCQSCCENYSYDNPALKECPVCGDKLYSRT